MGDEQFEELLTRFGSSEGDMTRTDIVDQLADVLEASEEATSVLDALVGAWTFGRLADLSQEGAGADVANSDELKLDSNERSGLAVRLASLFHSPVLDAFAHATSLVLEDDHSYCTSRILSDLRPMFGPDDDVTPTATLIRHSLRFDVHTDGRLESVLISIDERGLEELAAGVERANKKAKALRMIAHQAGLRVVDLEETH